MDSAFGRRSVVAQIGEEVPAPAAEAVANTFAPGQDKYAVVAPLGSGGMGEVMLVQDRDLRRDVAMKVLRSEFAVAEAMKRKFIAEAQATSQLEHPGIPPVHDIGVDAEGKVWFTMKVVRGRTLTELLRELLLGRKETRTEYTLHKLITVLERIAEAVHFAHEKGVIHRDLKPDNVMLGEFGEVHVMDWGIAKVAESDAEVEDTSVGVRTVESDQAMMTQVGTIKGTIPYMSPEQARGEQLDRRSDVYALGAILYEMLTLMPAFEGGGVALLLRVRSGEYPAVETRNPRRVVPEPLAALQRRAMAMDPAARPQSAHEFAVALRTFLDGRAERERRHREAEALAVQGREAMARYAAAVDAGAAAQAAEKAEAAKVKPWWPVEKKTALVAARRSAEAMQQATALAFAEVTRLLDAALVTEEGNANARAAFADLWRGRLVDAEWRGHRADTAHALTMIRRYDDGRLASLLAGDGSLELASDPPGAQVTLTRLEDHDGVLKSGAETDLGATPIGPAPLPMGSYLCVLRHPGFRDVRYPVHITRNRAWAGRVKMRTDREIGDGFVFVPGGPFVYGEGTETTIAELPDFAISARPVSYADWALFLEAVERESGIEAARTFVPGTSGEGLFMESAGNGTWRLVDGILSGPVGEILAARHGPDLVLRSPVVGIPWFAAAEYCAWKSRSTGIEWRLPTEQEREKAARGVDGRTFPWGELADASLGKCGESREEAPQPEPTGSFPAATSIYGMLDASGNTWDWTGSESDERSQRKVVRGGCWSIAIGHLRCANRTWNAPAHGFSHIGFRPARTLEP
ncbi:MAG: Serine/threonine-protein kinase PknD [Planctomycetes bacterium]|nr:Serine/threonine-protein kinase PknD [Planctomycetota bacterium]